MFGVEKGFDERAGGAFTLGGGDTDDRTGAVVKEITGEAGLVVEV